MSLWSHVCECHSFLLLQAVHRQSSEQRAIKAGIATDQSVAFVVESRALSQSTLLLLSMISWPSWQSFSRSQATWLSESLQVGYRSCLVLPIMTVV
eukprot:357583-Alexandrium_andersonii.AAC.1